MRQVASHSRFVIAVRGQRYSYLLDEAYEQASSQNEIFSQVRGLLQTCSGFNKSLNHGITNLNGSAPAHGTTKPLSHVTSGIAVTEVNSSLTLYFPTFVIHDSRFNF